MNLLRTHDENDITGFSGVYVYCIWEESECASIWGVGCRDEYRQLNFNKYRYSKYWIKIEY